MRAVVILAVALVLCGGAGGGSFAGGNGLVVFTRTAAGAAPELVAYDPGSGAERVLGQGTDGAWSPDGARLAFVRDGIVYVAAADGTGAKAVGAGEEPAWSPDGKQLVVARAGQLVVLDLDDGSARQLPAAAAELPAWSPDGGSIAFATAKTLAVVAADGLRPATPLTLPTAVEGGPSWSPDGRQLAFLAPGGNVWTAAADGAGARQLTYVLAGSSGPAARPAWSPDGGAILFTAGADLCVTDLAGAVHRLTRSPAAAPALAALPDWQRTGTASAPMVVPPPGADDARSCDWSPGARVELLDLNVAPLIVGVAAPDPVVFVNHLTRPLTIVTTMGGAHGTVAPGSFLALDTVPGEYDYTVSGYPDGMPRRGSFVVAAAGRVTLDQHAAIRFGTRTVLTGVASGKPGGVVTVTARPHGAPRPMQLAIVTPVAGRWRLAVAPAITTRYRVGFEGATAERDLRVMPSLRVSRSGRTLSASLAPARRLAGRMLFVFRSSGRGWNEYRSLRVGRSGGVQVRNLPRGRYYVGFQGGADYWGTASEPFTVRG